MKRRTLLKGIAVTGLGLMAGTRIAQAQNPGIKIGVLTDMSSAYSDVTGESDVVAAKMAAADFMRENPSIPVEVVSADFQLKADIASNVARQWYDLEGVDAIASLPFSSAALAASELAKAKDKVVLMTSTGLPDMTGKHCTMNQVQWTMDTFALSTSMASYLVEQGKKSWFFIVPDYSVGHSMANDAAKTVEKLGGKVVGSAVYAFPGTSDFSSYLLQAQNSGAEVICLANAGSDTINCVKQAFEFGLPQSGITLATIVFNDYVAHAIGVDQAQGIVAALPFYWDTNDDTRAFAIEFSKQRGGMPPNFFNAGIYSAVTHYLKAVKEMGVEKAKASGKAAIAQMKAMPVQDKLFQPGKIREDGKHIHPITVYRVKSKDKMAGERDYFEPLHTVPGEQAFMSLEDLACPLLKS